MTSCKLNRRRFIQTTTAVAASIPIQNWAAEEKSRIVEIHRPGILKDTGNNPDAVKVKEMLTKAMKAYTGESSTKDQWTRFITKDDVVGIKVNCLGGPRLSTKKELVQAIIENLLEIGVEENNIIIWDRRSDHLRDLGMSVNTGKTGIRVYATDHRAIGYDSKTHSYPSGASHLSKIWTQQVTAIVNVPIMKDHRIAGTTLSLKNISHGVIDNPFRCHRNGCDPYIAEINALPEIREKHKIVIMDALQGCFQGGPRYRYDGITNYESIYIAEDCVALDAVGTKRINDARTKKGLRSVADAGTPASYIATANQMKLGNSDFTRIDHQVFDG